MVMGLVAMVKNLHELKNSTIKNHFQAGRINGIISCLAKLYGVSYNDAKRVLYDDQPE